MYLLRCGTGQIQWKCICMCFDKGYCINRTEFRWCYCLISIFTCECFVKTHRHCLEDCKLSFFCFIIILYISCINRLRPNDSPPPDFFLLSACPTIPRYLYSIWKIAHLERSFEDYIDHLTSHSRDWFFFSLNFY